MWKPGTRVVKVAMRNGPVTDPRGVTKLPIGTCATILARAPHPLSAVDGTDAAAMVDGVPVWMSIWSEYWRPLDLNDTTGITTTSALLRSLQGRVEA